MPSSLGSPDIFPKNLQVLLSRNFEFYNVPEKIYAIKIQSFIRMKIAQEKYKLILLNKYRKESYKIIGRGGTIFEGVPFFVMIYQFKFNFFIKVKNLVTEKLFYADIKPDELIFGYIRKKSYRLIIKSIIEHNKCPSLKYYEKDLKNIDVSVPSYLEFKKYSEKMSLHSIVTKIQSLCKAKKTWKEFQKLNTKEIQHFKKKIDKVEYRVAMKFKKNEVFIDLYLIKRPEIGKWQYIKCFSNDLMIERYGEINPKVILRDLTIENEEIILGEKKSIESFQLQKNLAFALNEVIIKQEKIIEKVKNSYIVRVVQIRYKNDFFDDFYEYLVFQTFSMGNDSGEKLRPSPIKIVLRDEKNYREISISVEKASEKIGIPSLWIYPLSNYLIDKCLIINDSSIGLVFTGHKINLNKTASIIQRAFRSFHQQRIQKNKNQAKKRRISLKYRKTFIERPMF